MLRFVALSVSVVLAASAVPAQDAAAIAFEGVTVVPMDRERTLPDYTVVVRGDRIVAVGPDGGVVVPEGAARVDGRGRWLVPGLAEMHGHVPPPSAPAELAEETLFLYVSQGVTTVRGMLGAPGQIDLRARANSGEILSPTLYLAGPSFNGTSVSSPEQAEAMVRQQAAEGWDLLKVHPGLTRAEYDALAETAAAVGLRFGGHVPADVGIEHALAMGQETFDHVDGYAEALGARAGPIDPDRLDALVHQSRGAGAWIVPTMALWETILGALPLDTLRAYPELAYVPPAQVAAWTAAVERIQAADGFDAEAVGRLVAGRNEILRALHAGGVGVLLGTDAPQLFSVPGFSLHRELPRMAAAGMSPYEILRSGTALVGEHFADKDAFGLVAPGHRADLLLLDADPLADAAHLGQIAGVMVRGRWLPRSEIDARLDALRATYAD